MGQSILVCSELPRNTILQLSIQPVPVTGPSVVWMRTYDPLSGMPVNFEIASAAQAYNYIEPSAGVSSDTIDDGGMEESSMIGGVTLASIPQFEGPANPSDRIVTIGSGDALGKVMQKEGVGASEVHEIITAMGKNFNPRDLKVGQERNALRSSQGKAPKEGKKR